MVTELATERLRLDAVLPTDADGVLEYCNDTILQQNVPVPVPYIRETAEGYVVAEGSHAVGDSPARGRPPARRHRADA
ncbi:MAG: hypothetical protein ABIS08_09510 [Pseudolysinimonas sp.]